MTPAPSLTLAQLWHTPRAGSDLARGAAPSATMRVAKSRLLWLLLVLGVSVAAGWSDKASAATETRRHSDMLKAEVSTFARLAAQMNPLKADLADGGQMAKNGPARASCPLLAVQAQGELRAAFDEWKKAHGKSYASASEVRRSASQTAAPALAQAVAPRVLVRVRLARQSNLSRGRPCAPLPVQHESRYEQFRANLRDIVDFNERNPHATWWAAPNQFTDLSFDEFRHGHLGPQADPSDIQRLAEAAETWAIHDLVETTRSTRRLLQQPYATSWPPEVVDWVAANMTTPVKEQGSVRGC